MTYHGLVTAGRFAAGSKSEHQGVFIETPEGRFLLRRQGGNAFQDDVLRGLIGKRLRAEGQLHQSTLILERWSEEAS